MNFGLISDNLVSFAMQIIYTRAQTRTRNALSLDKSPEGIDENNLRKRARLPTFFDAIWSCQMMFLFDFLPL